MGGEENSAHPITYGVSDNDWVRLHHRVVPNAVPMEEFKSSVVGGRLHLLYLAKDLHKIMQELRDILQEHGELREAASFPLTGRKSDLSLAAAAAVRIIDTQGERLQMARGSTPTSGGATAGADGCLQGTAELRATPSDRPLASSTSPLLDSSGAEHLLTTPDDSSRVGPRSSVASAASPTPHRRSSRILPLVDHISDDMDPLFPHAAPGLSSSSPPLQNFTTTREGRETVTPSTATAVRRAMESTTGNECRRLTTSSCAAAAATQLWISRTPLGATIARNAAGTIPGPPLLSSNSTATPLEPPPSLAAPLRFNGGTPSTPLLHTTTADSSSSGGSSGQELAQLNAFAPPFFRLLNIVRRLQLRYGSYPTTFAVPVQYAEAVSCRRLRLYLIPLRHPNVPVRWPAAKEMALYLNDQCMMVPWKRSWPERKVEVAKTFLPLDLTHLLSRSVAMQRLKIDIFNQEYITPAILAIVQPQAVEEVLEQLLEMKLGCRGGPASVIQRLSQATTMVTTTTGVATATPAAASVVSPPAVDKAMLSLQRNDDEVHRFYADVMEEDAMEEEDRVVVEAPVLTTKCPISQLPLRIPVRGLHCRHLQCVDLEALLLSCHKGCYWNCAICDAEVRPQHLRIDTVLWQYLLSCGDPASYPAYLGLSTRNAGEIQPTGSRYFWCPSRRAGADADFVVDDDDNDDDRAEADSRESNREEGVKVEPCVSPSSPLQSAVPPSCQWMMPFPTADHDASSLPVLYANESDAMGRKRSREASLATHQGTADDPIEL